MKIRKKIYGTKSFFQNKVDFMSIEQLTCWSWRTGHCFFHLFFWRLPALLHVYQMRDCLQMQNFCSMLAERLDLKTNEIRIYANFLDVDVRRTINDLRRGKKIAEEFNHSSYQAYQAWICCEYWPNERWYVYMNTTSIRYHMLSLSLSFFPPFFSRQLVQFRYQIRYGLVQMQSRFQLSSMWFAFVCYFFSFRRFLHASFFLRLVISLCGKTIDHNVNHDVYYKLLILLPGY